MKRTLAMTAAVLCAWVALAPTPVGAQTSDSWQFDAIIYLYFPRVDTDATYTGPGGTTINADTEINPSKIYQHLKMGFLGAIDAHKGSWGAFTDVMYLNIGGLNSATRNVAFGGIGVPASASLSTSFGMKTTVWTLAGTYRVLAEPDATMDVLAGARLLDIKLMLGYQLSGNLGPIVLPGRSGSTNADKNDWDAIVGVKGRAVISGDRKWFVPYYLDVGTGESKLTWQGIGGIGYGYSWGNVTAVWRYLDYHGKSGSAIDRLSFNGPMLGVGFHW